MREVIIIDTESQRGQELKDFLKQKHFFYRVYQDNESEEEIWRRDILLANEDEARNKEITEWNKISKVKDKQGW